MQEVTRCQIARAGITHVDRKHQKSVRLQKESGKGEKAFKKYPRFDTPEAVVAVKAMEDNQWQAKKSGLS